MSSPIGANAPASGGNGPGTALCVAVLIALCAAVMLPGLASMPLADPDESRCAMVAQEMLRTGQWLMPHLDGDIYWNKPAPFFWLAAAGQRLTGSPALGGRLVSAVAATLLVLILFAWMRRVAGQTTGLLAGVILVSGVLFVQTGRWYRMDMPLAACIVGALGWYWRYEGTPKRTLRWVGFYAFCAVATLLKGPAGLLLPAMVVGAYLLLTRQWRRLAEPLNYWGILVFVLVACPWYVAVSTRYPEYLNEFIIGQNFSRFAGKTFGSNHQLYGIGYVGVLLGGMLPWSVYLSAALRMIWPVRPAGARGLFASWRARQFRPDDLFLLLAVVVPSGFFMVSSTQIPSYILPVLPPMAGLMAMPLGAWIRGERPLRPKEHVVAMIAMVGLAAAVTVAEVVMGWLDSYTVAMWMTLLGVITVMEFAVKAGWKRRMLACVAAGTVALLLWGGLPILWKTYDLMSLKSLAMALPAAPPSGRPPAICCWGPSRYSLSVYADAPMAVRFAPRWGQMDSMVRFMLLHDGYCLWESTNDLAQLEAVARTFKARAVTLAQTPEFKLVHLERQP